MNQKTSLPPLPPLSDDEEDEKGKTAPSSHTITYTCAYDGQPFVHDLGADGRVATFPVDMDPGSGKMTLSKLVFCRIECAKGFLVGRRQTHVQNLELFEIYIRRYHPEIGDKIIHAAPDPTSLSSCRVDGSGLSLKEYRRTDRDECLVIQEQNGQVRRNVCKYTTMPQAQWLNPKTKGLDREIYYNIHTTTSEVSPPEIVAATGPDTEVEEKEEEKEKEEELFIAFEEIFEQLDLDLEVEAEAVSVKGLK